MLERGPGHHRHRVGVVEEQRVGLGDLADVVAEVEHRRDAALAVHDAAGADGVADALVDAVLQRDADVVGEGLEAADADAVHHVAGAGQRLAAVGGGGDLRRQAVHLDDAADDLGDHVEVVGVDVGQRDLDAGEFRHLEDVGDELLGEADAAGADDGDLERGHVRVLCCGQPALRVLDAGEGGQPVAVGGEQVVGQRPDLVEVELGGGVRVEHRGVVDVLGVLGRSAPATVSSWTLMLVRISAIELRRDVADDRSAGCRCVDEAGHLDGAAVGQRGDAAAVADVAVDHRGLAGPRPSS